MVVDEDVERAAKADLHRGMDTYQDMAMRTAMLPTNMGGPEVYPIMKINGEAGELAELCGKTYRDNGGVWDEARMAAGEKELGDILWYVAVAAEKLGMSLGDVAVGNIEKLADRKARGVIQGSGDNR